MVKGLNIFRVHFQNFADRYVLIGGTACDIAMTGAGLPFRATKDLDIVLCVEALDTAFVQAFWAFVRAGNYQAQEKSTGQKQFYRFQKPTNENYPFMLELFSRQPDVLQVAEGSHLTPLPMEEDVSSLSAILMDADYYGFIQAGRQQVGGLPVVGAMHLVPLKARAWLDLTQRQMAVILIVYLGEASRTVRELAAELGIGKPAITRALDKLEGLGLVKRLADVRDKRSIIVGRTVQGTVYLRELADRITKSAAASRR